MVEPHVLPHAAHPRLENLEPGVALLLAEVGQGRCPPRRRAHVVVGVHGITRAVSSPRTLRVLNRLLNPGSSRSPTGSATTASPAPTTTRSVVRICHGSA